MLSVKIMYKNGATVRAYRETHGEALRTAAKMLCDCKIAGVEIVKEPDGFTTYNDDELIDLSEDLDSFIQETIDKIHGAYQD